MKEFSENIVVQPLSLPYNFHTTADVLRLDLIHPIISGNKWFKLKEYITEARQLGKKTIVTFGGAYSNHIVATAAAANLFHFNSVGIIRGEQPPQLSHTLTDALQFGMKLYFVSREAYSRKMIPEDIFSSFNEDKIYTINEGGYGLQGKAGAQQILQLENLQSYSHIIAAVGTGTTLAGLVAASKKDQHVIGLSVLKNNFSLENEIKNLLSYDEPHNFELLHNYHFGGYAKYNEALLQFMNDFYTASQIPTDFVYTAKLFFGVHDLLKKNYFSEGSKLLIVHSGGLQGNRSLSKGKLIFN